MGRTVTKRKEDRHQELLRLACLLVVEGGVANLTIDGLAKKSGFSRPTVYGHFDGKQAALNEVAQLNLDVTQGLMGMAATFEGTVRERMFAMILAYEVLARFHPDQFHMTEFLEMPWVRDSLPDDVASAFGGMVTTYYQFLADMVKSAVAKGELELDAGTSIGNVVNHSVMMCYGTYTSIIKERVLFLLSEPVNPWVESRRAVQAYWDGIGWAKEESSCPAGQDALAKRILEEVFPDYWDQLPENRRDDW